MLAPERLRCSWNSGGVSCGALRSSKSCPLFPLHNNNNVGLILLVPYLELHHIEFSLGGP